MLTGVHKGGTILLHCGFYNLFRLPGYRVLEMYLSARIIGILSLFRTGKAIDEYGFWGYI